MLFNSIPFIIFFPIVVLLYYLMPAKIRYVWLLICSYFFYLSQSTSYVLLLLLTTISTYVAGIVLNKAKTKNIKDVIIAVTVLLNVGILAFIKYADFALELFGTDRRFNFFIPIGISFYTLQAITYLVDLYRGKIEPVYNPARYALYVSFFPSLLSGPINRAQDLLPELSCAKSLDLVAVKEGMQKMLWGYFLKLCIAARLTIIVDTAYANVEQYSGSSLVVAAVAFLFMLYCDFEGYSCIAIGAAKILGIRMKDNFRQPFYATSVNELWSRWHISLSTWFKEYLYYPLGGSRKGTLRRYINIMVIFVVSGLWHGANYTFFVWGILNGTFRILGDALLGVRNKIANITGYDKHTSLRITLERIGVYILYGFTMIFFSNDNIDNAWKIIVRIATQFQVISIFKGEWFTLGLGTFNFMFVIVLAIFVLVVDGYCNRYTCDVVGICKKLPMIARWCIYFALITMILFSANLTGQEFIYAQM